MAMATVRNRILHFLQLSRCSYQLHGNHIETATAVLILDEEALVIERPGKPRRSMPYSKLNLDRLLFLINPTAARASG